MMINLEKQYLTLLKQYLHKYIPDQEVWLFGSRVTEKIKAFSDIDIAVINEAPLETALLAELNYAFKESDLPYKVDIVEWQGLSNVFKKNIEQCYEVLQKP